MPSITNRDPGVSRLYTVHEANALIPRLQILIPEIQAFQSRLQKEIQELSPGTDSDWQAKARSNPVIQELLEALSVRMKSLDQLGVFFQGFELGLVDFPAEIDGKPVLLCWQYGEQRVEWYHELDSGFRGRKRLPRMGSPARYD